MGPNNLKMIVAASKSNGIGYKGKMPWYIPMDMEFFKKMTIGKGNNAVIMGRNTWESLPRRKYLPGRDNLILSRSKDIRGEINNECIHSFGDVNKLMEFCDFKKYDETWVIGGSEIYDLFINDSRLQEIYKTHVNHEFECDTFFPKIPSNFEMKMMGSNSYQTLFYWNEKYSLINHNKDCP